MNRIDRIEKLRVLLNTVGGNIHSRKKLHKMVYLLQSHIQGEDFDQDFIFHYFGVFSPTLARDLDSATEEKLILEELVDEEYVISLSTETVGAVKLCSRMESLAQQLSRKTPQLLETLSTIVYLSKDYYEGQALKDKLARLKPKLRKYYKDAFKLALSEFGIVA